MTGQLNFKTLKYVLLYSITIWYPWIQVFSTFMLVVISFCDLLSNLIDDYLKSPVWKWSFGDFSNKDHLDGEEGRGGEMTVVSYYRSILLYLVVVCL